MTAQDMTDYRARLEEAGPEELIALLRELGEDPSSAAFEKKYRARVAQRFEQFGLTEGDLRFYDGQRNFRQKAHVRTRMTGELVQFVESLSLGQVIRPLAVILSAVLEGIVFYQGASVALGVTDGWIVTATAIIITLFYLSMAYSLAEALYEHKSFGEKLIYGLLVGILGMMMLWFGSVGRIGPERLDAIGAQWFGLAAPENALPLTASVYIEVIGLGIMSFAFLVAEVVSVHVLYANTGSLLKKDALAEIARIDREKVLEEVLRDLAWKRIRLLEKSKSSYEKASDYSNNKSSFLPISLPQEGDHRERAGNNGELQIE